MNKKLTTFDCIAGACSLSKTKKINGINQIFKIKNQSLIFYYVDCFFK